MSKDRHVAAAGLTCPACCFWSSLSFESLFPNTEYNPTAAKMSTRAARPRTAVNAALASFMLQRV